MTPRGSVDATLLDHASVCGASTSLGNPESVGSALAKEIGHHDSSGIRCYSVHTSVRSSNRSDLELSAHGSAPSTRPGYS
jgi:hypothetical protein